MGLFGPTEVEKRIAEKEAELSEAIIGLKALVADLKIERDATTKTRDLTDEITKLKEEIETLRITKARKDEEFAQKEREIKHDVGLHQKQVEFEIEKAKTETALTVREENLNADRARFEEQMRFTTERFESETKYLKELMESVLLRLPSVEVNKTLEFSVPNGNGHKSED